MIKFTRIVPLIILLGMMAVPSHADGLSITFTCGTCTTAAPTGTISSTGDFMVTWSTLGTFDLGNLGSFAGFTSPSILTPGYTGGWAASAGVPLFDMENQGGTSFFFDFVGASNQGTASGQICVLGNSDCVWTDAGTYTINGTTATPEPGTFGLLFAGLVGVGLLFGMKRYRNNSLPTAA